MPEILDAPAAYKNQSPATPAQIALWAKQAGFPDGEIATAVAVALAESGGKLAAVSPVNSNGSRDYGLWQINSKAHPQLFNQYENWWAAGNNARMAKAVWDGAGWRAWTTYTSGRYRNFLDEGEEGAGNPTTGATDGDGDGASQTTQEAAWFRDTKDALAQVGNAFAAIAQAVFKAGVWMANPHNWVRAALVGLGGSLVVGALVLVAKPNTSPVAAVTAAPKAAGKVAVAPVRVAAKTAKAVS